MASGLFHSHTLSILFHYSITLLVHYQSKCWCLGLQGIHLVSSNCSRKQLYSWICITTKELPLLSFQLSDLSWTLTKLLCVLSQTSVALFIHSQLTKRMTNLIVDAFHTLHSKAHIWGQQRASFFLSFPCFLKHTYLQSLIVWCTSLICSLLGWPSHEGPLQSPLLRLSIFLYFPPASDMLKFAGSLLSVQAGRGIKPHNHCKRKARPFLSTILNIINGFVISHGKHAVRAIGEMDCLVLVEVERQQRI